MSSEAGIGSSVLSSIRKLLGDDDTETQESEIQTDSTPEAGDDGDDLVLGPAMRTQMPKDASAVIPKGGDASGADTYGNLSQDAGSILLGAGPIDADSSSVEFNDDIEIDGRAGTADGGDPAAEAGGQQDFDPAVWRPVLPGVSEGVDAGKGDEPVTSPEDDRSDETVEDPVVEVDDDKLEEMPVSDLSEDDEVTESAAENKKDAQDEEVSAGPDETAVGGGEDFQELLEDTVRRIVREELTGDLGQRLSQNIQKMIRDQVAQAVTSRD